MDITTCHPGLLEDLSQALRASELCVHVQPQYAHDGRVTGAELLVRWAHPQLGPIPPAEFVPLAQRGGLLNELTCWVCARACDALSVLQAKGATHAISINVSAESLADPSFVRAVRAMADRVSIPSGRLVFEVTEEAQIKDAVTVLRHMRLLNQLGILFSVDDFGVGYANLGLLTQFPFYELKVDKSLIDGVPDDPNSVAIVRLLLALARRLKLRVVAEGVEATPQADFLFRHRCDAVQGYLFARPMPVDTWLDG